MKLACAAITSRSDSDSLTSNRTGDYFSGSKAEQGKWFRFNSYEYLNSAWESDVVKSR